MALQYVTHKYTMAVMARVPVSVSRPSDPVLWQQTHAHEHERSQAHKRNKTHLVPVTPGQPASMPPPTLIRELTIVPHPNPLRNIPVGERLPVLHPLPEVATVAHHLSASTPGMLGLTDF